MVSVFSVVKNFAIILVCALLLCCGCAHTQYDLPTTAHANTDPFLIIFVDAKHLNYNNCSSLLKTILKHPDGSKNRDIGHAWIYLQGTIDGNLVSIEGGHSGELGITQAKYFDGIMNYLEYGYSNPTPAQMISPRYEPNPIKYLWEPLNDGFFQEGAGKHKPTFAVKINLNQEQFQQIYRYVTNCYDYSHYALGGNQCSSFVAQVAALAGVYLESEITISVPSSMWFNGMHVRLWEDPAYRTLTFSSPDILEKSMREASSKGHKGQGT